MTSTTAWNTAHPVPLLTQQSPSGPLSPDHDVGAYGHSRMPRAPAPEKAVQVLCGSS